MGLIFWNHGGGSISGVCFDELRGSDSLSLTEINSALAAASVSMTDKFEFIGFDACLMGTVETANILATYSRYMYGSEETEPGYGWDYTAIGDFLGEDPYADGADEVLSAIDKAVIYKRNGSDHSEACGLSAYYPLQLQGSAELEIFGDVAVSPYYLSFVDRTIYGSSTGGNTEDYDNSSILDLWLSSDDTEDYDDYWDCYGDCEPTGESPLIVFYDEPQFFEDGTFGFSLTDESLEYTAGVQANVYMISENMDDLIELGVSVDIIPDWENGIFTDNFDGYWFSLPDGQILAVYVVEECDGYDIYTSPVLINGEETNLRIIHDYENDTVTIDGIWDGIDENGMAARNVYELSEGDSITPLYYASAIDSDDEYYYYGDEYVFDGEPEIYFDLLYDGEYLYGFTIDDIFGDYFVTDFVNFTVDGKDIYYSELS